MFIAVARYKEKTYKILSDEDKVCIFDTDDCTAELVIVRDLEDFCIRGLIENFNYRYRWVNNINFLNVYPSYNNYFVNIVSDGYTDDIRIGKRSIRLEFNDTFGLAVQGFPIRHNNLDLFDGDPVFLGYLFLYKGYVVLRLNSTIPDFDEIRWFTVAVDENDNVYYWDESLTKTNNKALAVEIDTLSEV